MSDRVLMAYAVAILLASFMTLLAWRVWYLAPAKVRSRSYRKQHASDVAALEEQSKRGRS